MKSKALLILISIFFSLNLLAGEVTKEQAKKAALNFYFEKYNQLEGSISYDQLMVKSTQIESDGAQNIFYVFHFNAGGFVLISAENSFEPIFAYSLENDYISENQPINLEFWINQYKEQVSLVRAENMQPSAAIEKKWKDLLNNNYRANNKSRSVEYLITTKWNQGWPYNSMCPVNDEGQAVSGCVATGYAQLLYYWRFPLHGSGDHCYYHPDYGQLCADFENTWYQWDAMTDVPRINDSAVGELMYHLGVALDMDYGPDGSGTWQYPMQIEQHFNVSSDLMWKERDNYSTAEWKNLLRNQLDQAYPLGYVGYSNSGGHFWVCDGYDEDDLFHMNWGWGGSSDGYFQINSLLDFSYGHSVGINFYPDSDNWTYPNYASGADTLTYLEGSISDGSGPVDDYLNNTTATWLITPQTNYDSISSITLKFKRFDIFSDGDKLNIYAGEDNNSELVAQLSGNEIEDELEISSNKVFIEFITDGDNTAPGFYLNYECQTAVFCMELTELNESSAIITDGSQGFYYGNNTFCIFKIDPGIEGPLTLNFNYFDTELDFDKLKIYDAGAKQELLAVISGHYDTAPESVTAPSGKINMVFTANASIQGLGWEAWYDVNTGVTDPIQDYGFQIIPNPVTSAVQFNFNLENKEEVMVEVIDMLGHQKMIITNDALNSGFHSVYSDLSALSDGIYFCRLHIGDEVVTKKIVKVE